MKNLMRVGLVSSVNPAACSARVTFEDQAGVVSHELPVLVRGAQGTKDYWLPTPGELVWCLFLPTGRAADGIILGTTYTDEDAPPTTDPNKRMIAFPDGTRVEYDMATRTLAIDCQGTVTIRAVNPVTIDGDLIVTGTISQGGG